MATILCVLYDDPVDGYPPDRIRATRSPRSSSYPDGQTTPTPEAIDFTPGELLGSVSGELGLRKFLEDAGHDADRHLRQGRSRLRARPQPRRRRGRDLTALLARLHDRGANREGAEPEADHHRRDRLRPHRPRGRDRGRRHGRRGHLLQLDLGLRARRDDDPLAGPQLHPDAPDRPRRRLEHRRRRLALLRRRGDAGRDRRGRADRHRRAAAPKALRRRPSLHRPPPAPGRGRGGARRDVPRVGRGDGPGAWTWSRSTPRSTRRPSTSSTTR